MTAFRDSLPGDASRTHGATEAAQAELRENPPPPMGPGTAAAIRSLLWSGYGDQEQRKAAA